MPQPKVSTPFIIAVHKNKSGTLSYRVTGRMPDGTRVRKNYTNEEDAIRARHDLEMDAKGLTEARRAQRTILNTEQLADAEAATLQIAPLKISTVIAHYLNLRQRAQLKGITLDKAMAFVETQYREETKEITIFNAVPLFLKSRVGRSKKTLTNYENNLMALVKSNPNKLVHAFTVADIEIELSRYKNMNSRRTLVQVFSVFFNWAQRHHHCLENPCERLDRLPKDASKIVALTINEVKRLLYAAMHYREGVAAASIAISVFAGLRPSELAALRPEDIRDRTIIVRGGKRRRDGNRRVPIPEVLVLWLEKFPFTGLPGGWDYKMDVLKKATKAKCWVQDVLRHTSISYQADRDKNSGLTESNNGTSRDMMDRHYVSFIDNADAVTEYWNLTPEIIRTKTTDVKTFAPPIPWPSKEELTKLVWEKALMHVAADLGVSDVGLKKHCKKLGIDLPPRGHWLR